MLVMTEVSGPERGLLLAGRFDAHEVPAVRPVLQDVIGRSPAGSTVNLDLSSVDFFDSRALLELMHACQAGQSRGVSVRVGAGSPAVRGVLYLTGLDADLRLAA